MAATNRDLRNRSFGETWHPTPVDRFGIWLSARRLRRCVPSFRGLEVADVGSGYHATFFRAIQNDVRSMTLVDVSLAPDLRQEAKVRIIEGRLPDAMEAMADASMDVIVCNSVLEHLWEPLTTLEHFHRIIRPGGLALINVPSWRGKRFLELSAFRLEMSPPHEMDDHKMYYDPADLWPMLVRAGFAPRHIRCVTHKFGLNTFAECRRTPLGAATS